MNGARVLTCYLHARRNAGLAVRLRLLGNRHGIDEVSEFRDVADMIFGVSEGRRIVPGSRRESPVADELVAHFAESVAKADHSRLGLRDLRIRLREVVEPGDLDAELEREARVHLVKELVDA